MDRVIFHVDMNSYFASCEIAQNPELLGKPVVVGGTTRKRGVITTASYEARKFGVHAGMSLKETLIKCPNAVVLPVNMELYKSYAEKFIDIFKMICKTVEQASIDEAYLEFNNIDEDWNFFLRLAHKIQIEVFTQLGLQSSIGISTNKFLAKMGSDVKKPMGITKLEQKDIKEYIWKLPLENMHGVGPKTKEKLELKFNVKTIGDFAQIPRHEILLEGQENFTTLWKKANGIDESQVNPDRYKDLSSVGHSKTFLDDTEDEQEITELINTMCEKVATRLKIRDYLAQTVTVTLRNSNFQTINRSTTLEKKFSDYETLQTQAQNLFLLNWDGEPIRLVGVSVSNITKFEKTVEQLDIYKFINEIA